MAFVLLLLYIVAFYVRFDEQFPALAPYPFMYWIGVAASVTSLLSLLVGKRPPLRALQIYCMVGLTGMISLSVALTGWLGGAALALEEFGSTAMVFLLLVLNITSLRRMRIVATLIVVMTVFVASQGVLAYHLGYQEEKFLYEQRLGPNGEGIAVAAMTMEQQLADDGSRVAMPRIRSLGFLNDPNDLAQALLIALPLLGLAWRRKHWFRNVLLVGAPFVFLLYSIYLTRSRGGILGLLVLALLALRWRTGRAVAVVLTVLLAFALVGLNFAGGRGISDSSAEGRVAAWNEGLQFLKANPLSGLGYHEFSENYGLTAHNSFVLCFAELGLMGYFFWLSLLVVTVCELHWLGRRPVKEALDADLRSWSRAIFLALCTFLTAALFLSRTYIMTLYILLALGTALVEIARREDRPVLELTPMGWASRVGALEVASILLVYAFVRVYPA